MEVYLDNSATTMPYDEVVEEVAHIMRGAYGNPSSLHRIGKAAEDRLTESRRIIADTLRCRSDEIFFTSGGTESDNLAIIGYALANRKNGNKLITQKTEHMAVLEAFRYLESLGFEVYYADVDASGAVNPDDIAAHVDDKTILISIMHVNNETGALMPIEKIAAAKEHCALHVDAVQSYGKIPFSAKSLGADMITLSAHKIHGPNGVGALYIKKGLHISPIMLGGKQESGMRSGTENVAGICGFAKAAQIKFVNLEESRARIADLRQRLADRLTAEIENTVINSPEDGLYSILNVSFPGLKSEVLLHVLESKGIYVSTGSACNSKKNLSYVLRSMGVRDSVTDAALRISLSEFNTAQETDYCADVLKKEVPILRRIMK